MSVATLDPKHNVTGNRQAYYDKISKKDMAPLWEVLKDVVTPEPKTQMVPTLWKFPEVEKLMLEAGEVITADDGFYVIAGHNPGVHGAILTEALSSRFSTQIHVETDYDLCRQLGIDPKAVTIARGLAKLAANGEVGWAPQLRELIAFQKIADTIGLDVAFANLIGIAPIEDRDQVAELVTKNFKKVAALALGKQI